MAQDTAVIFGASGGIGSALCRILADKEWNLVLAARDSEKLEKLAKEVGGLPLIADATQAKDVDAVFNRAVEDYEMITATVNCVGSILVKPAHLTTDDEWQETIALNLTSSFNIVRAAARKMRKSGGAIALCSSAASQIGLANHEAIAAAKAGVAGLARSAAGTYASNGIRVNCVAPGLVDTPMAERLTKNENSLKFSLGMHPLGRIGKAQDIASALAWLIDPANDWVTGQTLGVEGGLASLKNH